MATSLNTTIPYIKVESGAANGEGPGIKTDPELIGDSPAANSEDDIYEDAGDLDFTGSEQSIFLSRLPKFLWECWSKLGDNQEMQIGRIRMEGQPGDLKRMSLMLDPSLLKNQSVPKEYNMHITNKESHNTFVFSEKDMPGYRQFQADGAPMHWLNRKRIEKKKTPGTFRRAVPKQTAIKGSVHTELNCQPVENEDYSTFTTRQAELSFRPKQKIQLLDDTPSGNVLAPGIIGSNRNFSTFINKAGHNRKKGQQYKAARMEKNVLLDLLFDLFKEYTYWPFSAIRQRTQQPEAYLKEVLDEIAFLPKSGPHMSQWQLKETNKLARYGTLDASRDEVAPDAGPGASFDGASDYDMNDDTMDMEDISLG